MKDRTYGEKIEIKGIDLKIEIKGILPAGQPLQLNFTDEKIYNCI